MKRAIIMMAALLALPLYAQTVEFQQQLEDLNLKLAAAGSDLRVAAIEWYTVDGVDEANTVYAKNVGNKQLAYDWSPFHPFQIGAVNGDEISYLVDTSDSSYWTLAPGNIPTLIPAPAVEAAIDRSMQTWDDVQCSKGSIVKIADDGSDPDIVDYFLGFGSYGTPRAEITHAGFTPPGALAPGILAVTYTLLFVDNTGNYMDYNGDGKYDVGLREIYYSGRYYWSVTGAGGIDIETVSLHEAGHGLSQGHFGTVALNNKGELKLSPRAVMNANYSGVQRELAGTDRGGHCSIWGNWPNH